MKNWIFFCVSLLCVCPIDAFSQTFTLDFTVLADKGKLDFVEVYLLDVEMKSILHAVSGADMPLVISAVPEGKYKLKVSAAGCEDYFESIKISEDQALRIQLKTDPDFELEEVEIVASKKIFSNERGNLKVTVENSTLSEVSNPLDILARLPGVQLSANQESVSIIGKGTPLIYLNNQRISLDQFNTIPVQDLKDIELIQNPSAKYEAEGRAVLLVRLKARKEDGYNMSFSDSFGKKDGFNNYLAWNANFNQKKWSWKTNLGYNQLEPLENVVSNFQVLGQGLASDYNIKVRSKRPVFNMGGGLHYEFKEGNYFSVNVNSQIRSDASLFNTNSNLYNGPNQTRVQTFMDSDDARVLVNTNFNYQKKWGANQLFIGGQFVSFHKEVSHAIENDVNETGYEYIQDQFQDFGVKVYSGRIDYERELGKGIGLEMGLNSSLSRAETIFEITDLVEQRNSSESSYQFDEQNHAAYMQVSGSLKKIEYSLGTRVENVIASGRFLGNINELIDRNNTFLFPKTMIHVPIDSNQSLTFNYGRNISRPKFSDLSQISVYVNPFSIISGNSNLQSTLTQEVSANYQYKNNSLSLTYTETQNPVLFNTSYDEERQVYVLAPQNISSASNLNLSLNVPLSLKRWSSMNTLNLISSRIKDTEGIEQGSKPYLYVYTNHEFKLPKSYRIAVSAWGMTRRKEGLFQRNALFVLNTSFSKTFFEKIYATLAFNDIFHGMRFVDRTIIGPISSESTFIADSREVVLSLRYNLGSGKSRYRNKKIFEGENRVK